MPLRRITAIAFSASLLLAIGTPAQASHRPVAAFNFVLTGSQVPGGGDPNGVGRVSIILRPQDGLVCFNLRMVGIDPAFAGHVHRGPAGRIGPLAIPFFNGLEPDGRAFGCVPTDPALINEVMDNPSNFYLNIHNEEFGAGALRGQLG
jgi:hypothetical protein